MIVRISHPSQLGEYMKKLWHFLRSKVLNKETFIYFIIAEIIFWSPCIITAILGLCVNEWWWTAFGAICAFWAGPFTPAVPLQIGLTLLLKKIFGRNKDNERSKKNRNSIKRDKRNLE